ncbi:PadR family transcriptional regulator [Solwaraspora sp. WMMA2101]|uniref:PadR family transcriptional regulator n=1 Tax=Solwaraspora sp. WMMA2101 TaxID=3404124 RepID=UPI003B9502B1
MEKDPPRITVAVAIVLRIFLEDVAAPRYGYDLMQQTGFPSGKLYPILARLQAAGWLTKHREDADPVTKGRPVRWWYQLSEEGAATARRELAALHQQLAPTPQSGVASPAWRPA